MYGGSVVYSSIMCQVWKKCEEKRRTEDYRAGVVGAPSLRDHRARIPCGTRSYSFNGRG